MKQSKKRQQQKSGHRAVAQNISKPAVSHLAAGQAFNVEQAVQAALAHHRAGRLQQAEAGYRQILATHPKHPYALNLLGALALQIGHYAAAADLIGQAIAQKSDEAGFHSNLGEALRALGRLDEAIVSYRRALALRPDFTDALNNLGNALTTASQADEAVGILQRALELQPGLAQAHNNLGYALAAQGRHDDAIACYRRALALQPDLAEAHSNLGNALNILNDSEGAIACHRRALALQPGLAVAHYNLGNALARQSSLDGAEEAYGIALAIQPDYTEALNNLGNVLSAQGRIDEARVSLERAVALQPDFAEGYNNLGNAFKTQARLDEAVSCYRRAAVLVPNDPGFHSNLAYTLYFHPDYDAQAILAEHRAWAQRHETPRVRFRRPHSNTPDPDRPLRIGYVSPDLRDHPVFRFLLPLFQHHDRTRCSITCYSDAPRPDAATVRLRTHADRWHDTNGWSEERLTEQIRADGIDILVDVALHTSDNRLPVFARKPAPVQVSWLGLPGTTGLEAMDYRLTDPYLDPPGTDGDYSETSVRLPHSVWCYAAPEDSPDVNLLPALSAGYLTFGSLNAFGKVNARVLELWAAVLRAVPGSRLVLLADPGSHRRWALDVLAAWGVSDNRVEFMTRRGHLEHLALHYGVDIGLDPFPYNGHTTTCSALWTGVPVVSLVGRTAVGRGGVSILSNVGLPELIASSEAEYIQIAADLASDLPRLADMRAGLRSGCWRARSWTGRVLPGT